MWKLLCHFISIILLISNYFHVFHVSSHSLSADTEENQLWELSYHENLAISTSAIVKLRELLRKTASIRDNEDRTRFENVMVQLTKRIQTLIQLSDSYVEKREYSESSEILQYIIQTGKQLLDQKSLYVCNSKLGQSMFREALIGNVTWNSLVWHYGNWSLQENLSSSDQFYFDMATANVKNLQQKSSHTPRPYVLRFHIPQNSQTPSLAHFGHAMFDGLWPFILAYSQNKFSRCKDGASIYVLDIGLYLIPLLQTIFPQIPFIPFHSTSMLPHDYEPVDLTGIGMASFSSLSQSSSSTSTSPADLHPFFHPLLSQFNTTPALSLSLIRDVVYQQLNLTSTPPTPECIVLLSRNMPSQQLSSFHQRQVQDISHESSDLKQFHDLGDFVHTAMFYLPSTAQERRLIQHEHQLFQQLMKIFHNKFGLCVKHVELSHLSLQQQFEIFTTAKVVIGQHGAGLAYTPFMSSNPLNPGLVIELQPMINPTFHLACRGMGVRHLLIDRENYQEVYVTKESNFIEINSKALIKLIVKELEGWKAPSYGKVYNLTTPTKSSSDPTQQPHKILLNSEKEEQTCASPHSDLTCSLIPELGYIQMMIKQNTQPFIWKDSLHFINQTSNWLSLSFHDWEQRMKRDVYSKGYDMPQKIMASPTNTFDFYNTFLFDVINLTPGDTPPTIPVNQQSLDNYLRNHSDHPFPPHTLRFIHLKNRSLVDLNLFPSTWGMIPQQRQVQGPSDYPDIGFKLLDRQDSAQLRFTQPIIAQGESYYLRISSEKGKTFYDTYALSLLPAAFNPSLLQKITRSSLERNESLPLVDRLSLYFSERQAVTTLHYDQSGRGSVLCQLTGSKKIQLWSPRLEEEIVKPYEPTNHHFYRRSKYNGRSPQKESVELLERREFNIVLKAGWCVYFPVNWWHHVESLEDENVSTRFTVY